jgi:hypothetical protein
LGGHQLPGAAAKRVVVGFPMLIFSMVTDILDMELENPALSCPTDHPGGKDGLKHFREEG